MHSSLLQAVAYAQTFIPVRGGGGHGGGSSGGGGSKGGGGGSSGGGGLHSGSGGSSGNTPFSSGNTGGSSSSVGGFASLIIIALAVGIPILIIIVVLFFVLRSRKRSAAAFPTTLPMPSATPAQVGSEVSAGYQQLLAVDSSFDIVRFNESANRVFYAVQTAWCDRNPGLTRQVMADGIWQAHKQQIDDYISRGAHNELDNLAVQNIYIQHISVSPRHYITVRFVVYSSDYDVDDEGKVIKGNQDGQYWAEDWVFTRDAGVTTSQKPGIAESACPNCGAPMAVDSLGNCDYCHAAIMGGAYDWVLYRIDQLPTLEFAQSTAGPTADALAQMPPPPQRILPIDPT